VKAEAKFSKDELVKCMYMYTRKNFVCCNDPNKEQFIVHQVNSDNDDDDDVNFFYSVHE